MNAKLKFSDFGVKQYLHSIGRGKMVYLPSQGIVYKTFCLSNIRAFLGYLCLALFVCVMTSENTGRNHKHLPQIQYRSTLYYTGLYTIFSIRYQLRTFIDVMTIVKRVMLSEYYSFCCE